MSAPDPIQRIAPDWPTRSPRRWVSAHLFFSGDIYHAECDAILLDTVEPIVQAVCRAVEVERWFYIRYRESGPHIRVRFLPADDRLSPTLRARLIGALCECNPSIRIGELPADPKATAAGITHICWIDYEPELDRYGGPFAIDVAERLFHRSSCAALDIVRRTRGNSAARLGQALLVSLATAYSLSQNRANVAEMASRQALFQLRHLGVVGSKTNALIEDFGVSFERQNAMLSAYVHEALERLDSGVGLSDSLAEVRTYSTEASQALVDLAQQERLSHRVESGGVSMAIEGIFASYMHMMNNRLGVHPRDEPYLSFLIGRSAISAKEAGKAAH